MRIRRQPPIPFPRHRPARSGLGLMNEARSGRNALLGFSIQPRVMLSNLSSSLKYELSIRGVDMNSATGPAGDPMRFDLTPQARP